MFYSASTGGFYDPVIHGSAIPSDATPLTREEHQELLAGQSAGKRIVPGEGGRPVLADPPSPTVAELSEQLTADINRWRDEQENSPILFAHAGRSWDGGLSVRTRLQPMLSLPALPPGFFWTDAENNDVVVTMAELADLNAAHEAAIVLRGFEIHVRQRQMKAEVSALATVEALRAYVIGWPA